jgi:hypothetical protein
MALIAAHRDLSCSTSIVSQSNDGLRPRFGNGPFAMMPHSICMLIGLNGDSILTEVGEPAKSEG